jgi:ABC-type branched-subunit amino acid transport system ATPase component
VIIDEGDHGLNIEPSISNKARAATIVFVSIALIVDASPGIHPGSPQGLRGPIGASAATVSRIITASVVVRITIVDIARTDIRRIMTTVIVIGPIIGEIARSYRQVRPWAAATMLDLNHIISGAFAGLQKGLPGRCCIGHWGKAP